MARCKILLIIVLALALAAPSFALADQKKPAPKKTEDDHPTESLNFNYGTMSLSYKKGPTGNSTGPTRPALPTTAGQRR
jgi:hypothetical protein